MKLNQVNWKNEIKKHIGYNVAVILCAVLAIFFLVMTVISAFSVKGEEGIAVKEAINVSSAPLDPANQKFTSQVSGYLINYEDEKTQVDKILVVVGNGRERETIELDGMMLYPRLPAEIRYEWKTSFDFDRIHSLTVVVEGQHRLLENNTIGWEFNPNILLYGLLCAICCLSTVFVAKKRYYRYQEDQLGFSTQKQ